MNNVGHSFCFLFALLTTQPYEVHSEKMTDCVDNTGELVCLLPQKCFEFQTLTHRECSGGRVCCRKRKRNLFNPLRKTISNRKFFPSSTELPQWTIVTFPYQREEELKNVPDSSIIKYEEKLLRNMRVVNIIGNDESPDFMKETKNEQLSNNVPVSVANCEKYKKMAIGYSQAGPLFPGATPINIQMEICQPRFKPLIVGGTNATIAEFPHMAALGFLKNNEIDFLCGGTIISEAFILTAAHCTITTKWGSPVIARVGSAHLYSNDGINAKISKAIPHPRYTPLECYNDIGLIKLETNLKFNLHLRPACLADVTTKPLAGQLTIATGWGKTGFGRESSADLLKVPLKIVDNHKCRQYYKSDIGRRKLRQGITQSMICANGYEESTQDTCQGDSGGPLQVVLPGTDCMMQILGVTSFGKTCGAGVPGVYTKVASFLPWIESIVWQ